NYYTFVPFKPNEKSRLIDSQTFATNTPKARPIANCPKPVPNAFSVKGEATNAKQAGTSAVAYVQTNPQQKFPLEIPQG
ncbi:hypothetical protein ABTE09_21105, partial [Acinetobacter baumannii]